MAFCQAITKDGKLCGNGRAAVDVVEAGKFHCHLHHSAGVFRKQVEARRAERAALREERRAQRKMIATERAIRRALRKATPGMDAKPVILPHSYRKLD